MRHSPPCIERETNFTATGTPRYCQECRVPSEIRNWKSYFATGPKSVNPIVFGSIFAWRRSFHMQPVDMGDQLRFTGPPAEVETEHLVRAFGRRMPDPQADQQAGDQGYIHLHP